MEQTARALNTVCRDWLRRRRTGSPAQQVASVIQYHQKRNRAARRARVPPPRLKE